MNTVYLTIPLLHIDDSPADRLLVKEAIALTKAPFALYQCDCLDSALAYFQTRSAAQTDLYPRPALVLLDYDLGGDDTGCDFLQWFRLTQKNITTPVVMLSGTSGKLHVAECYAKGANHFISKPKTMERFKVIASTLYLSLLRPELLSRLQECLPDPRQKSAV